MDYDQLLGKTYKVNPLKGITTEYHNIFEDSESEISNEHLIKRARIVKRNDPSKIDTNGGLILGSDLNGIFKKGIIYEIIDYGYGDMIIRELGKCSDQDTFELTGTKTAWNHDVNHIIECDLHNVLMTSKELNETKNHLK